MLSDFQSFNFNKQLLDAISTAGYETPTLIQQKAIPAILNGQDVMGIAQTGTGKTAAFALPIISKLNYAQGNEPRALIVAPTRELVLQIYAEVVKYAANTDLRIVSLYGGLGPKTQIANLALGCDILVSTPGRLLDLYLTGDVILKKLKIFVLDEADKMMDMGFIGSIKRILEVVPRKRQNLLFSATMSDLVHKIAGDFLEFPTVVEVSMQATPAETVSQELYYVPNIRSKINLLIYLLRNDELYNRVLIFCKTKTNADNIFKYLERKYSSEVVRVIHGNKGQNTRINAMQLFKDGGLRFLVATDVAARGIDVSEISHVINFDVPVVIEDFVHRIGRTGRAEHHGTAITFCNPAEQHFITSIEKLIRQKIPVMVVPEQVAMVETDVKEAQLQAREIDAQKRKLDPDFKGAFHEKKMAMKLRNLKPVEKSKNADRKKPKTTRGKKFKN